MRPSHELDLRVLQQLSKKDMHAHVIDHDDRDPRLSAFPLARVIISTYYIVKGSEVVFVGTRQGLYNFALQED